MEAPPAKVPPNASHVTATILKVLLAASATRDSRPGVSPDETLFAVTADVHTSEPGMPNSGTLARPGKVVEAFSTDPIPDALVGTPVTADLTLVGDTRGVRWWISNVRPMIRPSH